MRHLAFAMTLLAALAMGHVVLAGDDVNEDYTLTMDTVAEINNGGSFDMTIVFTNNGIEANGVQGGVCTENEDVLVDSLDTSNVDALDTTFAAATVNPDVDADERNWNGGFLMNVITGATLAAEGAVHDLWICTYSHDGDIADSGTADCDALDLGQMVFNYCDIGSPPVTTAVIAAGDQNPIREEATVCIIPVPPFHSFSVDDITIVYLPADGVGEGASTISLDGGSGYEDTETSGFQCALGYDDTRFEATGMTAIGELGDMNDGTGPGFFGVNLVPDNGPGITVGVVYNLGAGTEAISFDSDKDVIEVNWITIPAENTGVLGETVFDIEWREDLGSPVLPNNVVADGGSISVEETNNGTVTLNGPDHPPFRRGDCNDDGVVNMADAIWTISELNSGGLVSECQEACDVNDDGMHDNSDAIYTLNYRFLGGPEPVSSFPDCGVESPNCDEYESC